MLFPVLSLARIRATINRQISLHPAFYLLFELAFLFWGLFWSIRPPHTEEALLSLGVVAAIVTIQGTMSDNHRVMWFVVILCFFVVSWRAIRKDRNEHDQQQAQIRNDERENFRSILHQDQQHFDATIGRLDQTVDKLDTTINQNKQHFTETMQSERSHFDRLLSANSSMQHSERQSFGSLLSKQEDLLNRQEELYEFSSGKMLPAKEPMSKVCDPLRPNDFLVQIGDVTWDTDTFPFTVLRVKGKNVISLNNDNGSILVSVNLQTSDGRTLARIDDRGIVINPSSGLLMRRDKNTLVLEDQFGHEVLNAYFANERTFRISGIVPYQDKAISIISPMFHGCFRVHGGAIGLEIN